MDEELLASKGIAPSHSSAAYVRDFALHIGERAALLQRSGSRAYGLVMDINQSEAAVLYSDNSVADYFAEPVTAELMDGSLVEASCYNLPVENIAGTNREYAKALLALAARLQFPDEYLDEIRLAISCLLYTSPSPRDS